MILAPKLFYTSNYSLAVSMGTMSRHKPHLIMPGERLTASTPTKLKIRVDTSGLLTSKSLLFKVSSPTLNSPCVDTALIIILLFFLLTFSHQVWRLDVSKAQADAVEHLVEKELLDVWAASRNWMDIMVGPQQKSAVSEALADISVHSRINIHDVQQ